MNCIKLLLLVFLILFLCCKSENYNQVLKDFSKEDNSIECYKIREEKGVPIFLSIVELLATPDKYRDKFVMIYGKLVRYKREYRIFLSDYDELYEILPNSIRVIFPENFPKNITDYENMFVSLEGRFSISCTKKPYRRSLSINASDIGIIRVEKVGKVDTRRYLK